VRRRRRRAETAAACGPLGRWGVNGGAYLVS
jgi:hypothetical protein